MLNCKNCDNLNATYIDWSKSIWYQCKLKYTFDCDGEGYKPKDDMEV